MITPEFKDKIPDYGDRFCRAEFLSAVASGWFNDYDGSAELCDGTYMTNSPNWGLSASEVVELAKTHEFSHVVWFNK